MTPQGEGPRLILVTGGARSGKSSFAERLAADRAAPPAGSGRVTYLATSEVLDEEMAARVASHRASRPAGWSTVECPVAVPDSVREHAGDADLFLLDCVTFWVTNLLFSGGAFGGSRPPDEGFNYDDSLLAAEEERRAAQRVTEAVDDLFVALRETSATLIAVTNEVGMGVVPEYPLARLYRDQQGWANQRLARAADEAYLLVAGLAVDVKALALPTSPSKESP